VTTGHPQDRPCDGYDPAGPCGATPTHLYPAGWRCPAHTPAALAGRPEPGAGRYCPPAICWCGHCPPPGAPRRVLVTGSRTWTDPAVIADTLRAWFHPGTVLVTGACPRGADAIAEHLWASWGGPAERHPADWPSGRGAGFARNAAMVALGADVCLAFIRDNSPGASHTARLAALAGIPVRRYDHPGPQGQEREKAPSGLTIEAAALGYIGRGWPVFLLGRSKRPVANCPACKDAGHGHDPAGCGCLTCHGFHAATTDPARLAAMLAAVPRGLLAVRTGTVSGLAVVDVDPRNGGQVDPALMTPTAAVATGGGGWHLYYRHPGGPLRTVLPGRAGVDVKADGGYVVAPPSVHPGTGRAYRWAGERPVAEMPPALAAALAPPSAADPAAPLSGPVPVRRAGGISSPDALLGSLVRAVLTAPQGRRRVTLYGAARGAARMVTAGALTEPGARAVLTAAGLAAEQTERDIRAAIDGAFRDEGAAA
jgi:Bifunctional DNA primase/polymerase, N-terminal/YspA, cpYpsA-related SLOG family